MRRVCYRFIFIIKHILKRNALFLFSYQCEGWCCFCVIAKVLISTGNFVDDICSMSLKWRSDRRVRSLLFAYFIFEKNCSLILCAKSKIVQGPQNIVRGPHLARRPFLSTPVLGVRGIHPGKLFQKQHWNCDYSRTSGSHCRNLPWSISSSSSEWNCQQHP